MGQRKSLKPSNFERAYRILMYLQRNTDSNHTVNQVDLRNDKNLEAFIGHKETFHNIIVNMAYAMNSNDDETIKNEKEWKIVFKDFSKLYGQSTMENDTEDSDDSKQSMHIQNLYYNHTFTYDEINQIIEGLLFSKSISTNDTYKIIEKIEKNLTSKFYRQEMKHVCKVNEPQLTNQEVLYKNLSLIQFAIDKKVQIQFRFNGYNKYKKLEPVRSHYDIVSPYYIVANAGKYYLLACKEMDYGEKKR